MTKKRFTIIGNNSEIGVKEHNSGDVIVLTHRDLNSEQFVAQIVTFLNEQNEAIEKLIAKEKYWEQKAIQRINSLEEENEKLKKDIQDLKTGTYINAKNHIAELKKEIEHLREYNNKLLKKPLLTDILPNAIEIMAANTELEKENEQLKNKIDVLEDDNETYHKSLEKLNLYTKRFIPTKCTNEFKDCKTNRYYWLDHEGNFTGCLELLNLLDCERELLESENRQLKGRLMEYEEQIER